MKEDLERTTAKEEILRVVEFFGGIGAIRKALERLGIPFNVVDYVEIDENAVKSYNAMYGTNFEPQDITKWNKDLKNIDLIMHGSPCTNFSTAGKQEGGDEGSGTASSLMYETLRNVRRIRPKYVIWENVRNLLSPEHIANWQKYKNIMDDFGYNSYAQVLNAKDYGIPQNRERVFTVSIRKDIDEESFEFPKKKLLTITLKDILEDIVDEKYYLDNNKLKSIAKWNSYQKPLEKVLGQESIAPTLTARGAGEEHSGMIIYSEDLKDTANIQEEIKNETLSPTTGKTLKYKGNQVSLPAICASRGRKINNGSDYKKLEQTIEINTDGISNCLTTVSKDNYVIEKNMKKQLCDHLLENNIVETYDVINHGYTSNRIEKLNNGQSIPISKNIAPTITTRPDELGVTVEDNTDLDYKKLRIRKLTPKECWHLMGFDDEDFEKASQVSSESQLYKQAGNSIVVNVLEAILNELFKDKIHIKKPFRFPEKQLLNKTLYDLLDDDYDPELVVLNNEDLKKVKDFGCDYNFGGSIVKGNIYPTITASYGKVSGNSGKIPCKEGLRILTSKEVWRLMGFDDEDFEKAAKVSSNAQLYKQAGNSIAVPVVENIVKNLLHLDDNQYDYRIYRYCEIIDYLVKALLMTKEIDEDGTAIVEFWVKESSFFLKIENYLKLKNFISEDDFNKSLVSQFVIKILELAIIKETELGYTSEEAKKIDMDLDELIRFLTDYEHPEKLHIYIKSYIRKQIRQALEILKQVKIMFKEATGNYEWFKICKSTTTFEGNILHFVFSKELNKFMKNNGKDIYIMLDLLRFNPKVEPNYYLIFKKILSTIGTDAETTIDIEDLYKYCVTLPRFEDVKRTNRAYTQRIRQPVERVLGQLEKYFIFEYIDKEPETFTEWMKSSIKIRWKKEFEQLINAA